MIQLRHAAEIRRGYGMPNTSVDLNGNGDYYYLTPRNFKIISAGTRVLIPKEMLFENCIDDEEKKVLHCFIA